MILAAWLPMIAFAWHTDQHPAHTLCVFPVIHTAAPHDSLGSLTRYIYTGNPTRIPKNAMALKRQKAPWAKLAHVQHAQQRLFAACSATADSSPATSPWASSCSCRDLHITQSFSCPRFPLMRVASHSHDDVTASLGGVDVVKHCAVFFSHAHLDA